ncbi:MAG: FkbM family methyltransferase [Candidatus Electryonea clarkiae]|nr:FkbM family methyltransferase [Candidatus Electryonea clarkiae]MDP8285974.1 FkbM family methyltransferase [Candidatus Electryonea clarkiae]
MINTSSGLDITKISKIQESSSREAEIAVQKPPIVLNKVPGVRPVHLVAYYDYSAKNYPYAERNTTRWFAENIKPNWTILDIGANIGQYAIMFSRLVPQGFVYAFEPTKTIHMLARNLEYNNVGKNIELIPQALGAKIGQHKDKIFRIYGKEPKPEEALYEFNTVDNFVAERGIKVDAIKCDVDSFDFEVLQGAREVMRTQNPYIVVELNHALHKRDTSPDQALRWMAEQGYVHTKVFDRYNYLFKVSEEDLKIDPSHRFTPAIVVEWDQ